MATAALAVLLIASRDDPLAGRIEGEPQQCIDLDRVGGPEIVDAGTILYRQNLKRVWRASLIGGCSALEPMATLIVEVQGRRVCANDRFRVRRSGTTFVSGYCRFGAFIPFDAPPG